MFKRLRMRLTLACTAITAVILLGMAAGLLSIAERQLRLRAWEAFAGGFNAVLNYTNSEPTLSYMWLAQTEADEGLMISIEARDTPLLYGSLRDAARRGVLSAEARAAERRLYGPGTSDDKRIFEYRMPDSSRYFAGTTTRDIHGMTYQILVVKPLEQEQGRILLQRQAFGALVALAVASLFVFSYFFTSRAIRPVEESRLQQLSFVSAASHELRSPLSVIQASVSSIEKAPPETARRFLQIIAAECARMSRLVSDLLTLARMDNGTWPVQFGETNLDALLLTACEAFTPMARGKNIRLSVSLPKEVLLRCRCDPERIEQVLCILLDNALCYTRQDGEIHLSGGVYRGQIRLSVADNGPGIPDAQKRLVFGRFYRADTSRRSKEHCGLGLSIAAEIAALHHGRITVEDTPGGGSTFTMWLPP